MKKFISAILVLLVVLSLANFAFAADDKRIKDEFELEDSKSDEVQDTDIVVADYEYTPYDDCNLLAKEKQDVFKESYKFLEDYIDPQDGLKSVYWIESDYLPLTVIVKLENYDNKEGYAYLYWQDITDDGIDNPDWYEMEHEFDDENGTVILTIEYTGPIAIVTPADWRDHPPKTENEVQTSVVYDSAGRERVIVTGMEAAEKPSVSNAPEFFQMVGSFETELLNNSEFKIIDKGMREIADECPENMAARYAFYLRENLPNSFEIRMDDIKVGDKVVVKLYDGTWHEQPCEIKEDGKVWMSISNSGLVVIFTEIDD